MSDTPYTKELEFNLRDPKSIEDAVPKLIEVVQGIEDMKALKGFRVSVRDVLLENMESDDTIIQLEPVYQAIKDKERVLGLVDKINHAKSETDLRKIQSDLAYKLSKMLPAERDRMNEILKPVFALVRARLVNIASQRAQKKATRKTEDDKPKSIPALQPGECRVQAAGKWVTVAVAVSKNGNPILRVLNNGGCRGLTNGATYPLKNGQLGNGIPATLKHAMKGVDVAALLKQNQTEPAEPKAETEGQAEEAA